MTSRRNFNEMSVKVFFCFIRFALQHILDVLRHVGSRDFYKELKYPSVNLQLPLLSFNKELPEIPKIMEDQSETQLYLNFSIFKFFSCQLRN